MNRMCKLALFMQYYIVPKQVLSVTTLAQGGDCEYFVICYSMLYYFNSRRRARAKEKGTFKFSAVKAQTRGKANSTGKRQNKKGKRIPKWKSKSSWKAGPDSQINTCVSSFETNAEYGLAISGITCLQLADS